MSLDGLETIHPSRMVKCHLGAAAFSDPERPGRATDNSAGLLGTLGRVVCIAGAVLLTSFLAMVLALLASGIVAL